MDDQAKAIAAIRQQVSAYVTRECVTHALELFDRAVSISRASQGSRVGTEEEVERVAQAIYAARYDGDYARVPWVIDAANGAIAALPEPLPWPMPRKEMIAKLKARCGANSATIAIVVDLLHSNGLLATPVTVTMEECGEVVATWLRDQKGEHQRASNSALGMAAALRRVLGDRIQIAGQSEGPQ